MRFLFIDDDENILESLQLLFFDDPRITFAQCRSIDSALREIKKDKPDVLFLDNHLSSQGNDGLQIVQKLDLRNVKVYATTGDPIAQASFRSLGIDIIEKTDLRGLRTIIGVNDPVHEAM